VNLSPPEIMTAHHDTEAFVSGEESLDVWLRRRAMQNQASGASRTYVVCDGERVVAYYTLASSAVALAETSSRFRRNMPDPIPVVVLGRLAVDRSFQKKGIGRALVRDAGFRIMQAADTIGIRGVIVHAISDEAKKFYEALGFYPSPLSPLTLMITLADLRASM